MLNEILEDYKDADEQDKSTFVKEFKGMLWKSDYRFKTYKRYYTYRISERMLHYRKDLIDLFTQYKNIEFIFCKSFYDKKMKSMDYIRIHVNNMYGYLANSDVYLDKEYYQLLLIPKREYYSTVKKLKNNEEVNCDEIHTRIIDALNEAEQIKEKSINKKLNLKWTEYKKIINTYIDKLFGNYMSPEEYEKIHGWEMNVSVDGWNEDNYVIRYFCKSLTGYLMNYVRDGKSKEIKKKKCIRCENEFIYISNKKLYCDKCKKSKQLEWQRISMNNSRKYVK